ncbi:hypothetical protein I4U23_022977 [Adineta vaga]|nr:hypothetical protein I4U23_022977 [Adineta vaga]
MALSPQVGGNSNQPRPLVVTTNSIAEPIKETPYGFARLYAGVRTDEDAQTTPILALHTWKKSKQQTQLQCNVIGTLPHSNQSKNRGILRAETQDKMKFERDEDILILPVEDIMSITVSSEIKEMVDQAEVRYIKNPSSKVNLISYHSRGRYFMRNLLCCTCHQTQEIPQEVTNKTVVKNATRFILVTIEYLRYGSVHTPSNVKVLSRDQQAAFYQKHMFRCDQILLFIQRRI